LEDETARPKGPRWGWGSWEGGDQPPLHQLRDIGERCKPPSGVRGKDPTENNFVAFPSLQYFDAVGWAAGRASGL